MTYTYNSDNTLQYKVDAKGQKTAYTYDSSKRLTMIQRYNNWGEDTCQRVNYSYDSNTENPSFSQYMTGRLATVQYNACVPNPNNNGQPMAVTEMYSYHPAGAVTSKQLALSCGMLDGYGN